MSKIIGNKMANSSKSNQSCDSSSIDKRKTKADSARVNKGNKKKKTKLGNTDDRIRDLQDNTSGVNELQEKNPKLLVEELKLFQNNNLLNQQDPFQHLQLRLNRIIDDTDDKTRSQLQKGSSKQAAMIDIGHGLSSKVHQQQSQSSDNSSHDRTNLDLNCNTENILTIKKGVLWQQQNHDRLHRRIFNRWKKRYFILTIDYLVCFKRSISKVGHSEMGKFLYKTVESYTYKHLIVVRHDICHRLNDC